MNHFEIREIRYDELDLLEDFLYEAIFQREGHHLLPRDVIKEPALNVYIEGFGSSNHDHCLVAEWNGRVVGAVWTRILSGEVKGFGSIDQQTPEFAISIVKEYRNKGIGTALMKEMLKRLKGKGYEKTSLAVQKDNGAVSMYQRVGFEIIRETEEEFLMVCRLSE